MRKAETQARVFILMVVNQHLARSFDRNPHSYFGVICFLVFEVEFTRNMRVVVCFQSCICQVWFHLPNIDTLTMTEAVFGLVKSSDRVQVQSARVFGIVFLSAGECFCVPRLLLNS